MEDKNKNTKGSMAEQLKTYLENTPKEQLERDWLEIVCKTYDIDPDDPNVERKIAWAAFKERKLLPLRKICPVILWFIIFICNVMLAVINLEQSIYLLFALNVSCGAMAAYLMFAEYKRYILDNYL